MMDMALYPGRTSILETQRLMLREMSGKDYPALSRILQDEKVMYAYNGAFSDEETKTWLQNQLRRYRDYGFGLWAVVLKSSNEMIGQCGLTMQTWKEQEKLEVGYLFAHRFGGITVMPPKPPKHAWIMLFILSMQPRFVP